MAGTLETMASPRAVEPVFCCCRFCATTEVTPSWSKTGFFAMSEVTVLLTEVVRPVADCCRVRASPRERASVAVICWVAVVMADWPAVEAERRLVRLFGSVGVTACGWVGG